MGENRGIERIVNGVYFAIGVDMAGFYGVREEKGPTTRILENKKRRLKEPGPDKEPRPDYRFNYSTLSPEPPATQTHAA